VVIVGGDGSSVSTVMDIDALAVFPAASVAMAVMM